MLNSLQQTVYGGVCAVKGAQYRVAQMHAALRGFPF